MTTAALTAWHVRQAHCCFDTKIMMLEFVFDLHTHFCADSWLCSLASLRITWRIAQRSDLSDLSDSDFRPYLANELWLLILDLTNLTLFWCFDEILLLHNEFELRLKTCLVLLQNAKRMWCRIPALAIPLTDYSAKT